jgi:hypothetical protein
LRSLVAYMLTWQLVYEKYLSIVQEKLMYVMSKHTNTTNMVSLNH